MRQAKPRPQAASFSQILDLAPGAISVATLDGGALTYWSRGGEQLFGWSSKEALGLQPAALLHTRFPRPQAEIEAEVVRIGHWEGRLAHTRKDGRQVRTMTRSVLERDSRGAPLAIVSLSDDLSQVLGNEDAVEASEERFRLLVAGVKDYAIFWLSPLGLVTTWNPGAESMTGYRANEIVGQHFACFYTPDHRQAGTAESELVQAAQEGCTQNEGWRMRKDGSRFVGNVVITALYDEHGSLIGFGTLIRDVTQQRSIEEERSRVLEEATVANRELEAFSYAVSHDLRAPLRAIDGFSQALLEDYADRLDEGGQEYLRRVRAASQRMGHLIDDLLRLSRLKRASLRSEPVDLSELAIEIASQLDETAPQRQVEWNIQPAMAAKGDPELLRIVLDNLLGNAFKFTSKTPLASIRFSAERSGGSTAFCVGDNGTGFDMAYVDRLFGPFQRLHSSAEFEGTGIGLATVQRIIQRHRGTIRADGVPGQGATFRFTLGRGLSNSNSTSNSGA